MKKLYVTVGAAVALLLLVTFGFGADALANIIGFAWPARNTLKALKAAASGAGADGEFDAAEFKFLTQYWLVFGAFVTAETFLDNFLSWVPYYFFCKVAFFVFCFLPQTRGAEYIVEHAFQPAYVWVQANLETPLAAEIEEVAAELSGNGKGKRGKASKAE